MIRRSDALQLRQGDTIHQRAVWPMVPADATCIPVTVQSVSTRRDTFEIRGIGPAYRVRAWFAGRKDSAHERLVRPRVVITQATPHYHLPADDCHIYRPDVLEEVAS